MPILRDRSQLFLNRDAAQVVTGLSSVQSQDFYMDGNKDALETRNLKFVTFRYLKNYKKGGQTQTHTL